MDYNFWVLIEFILEKSLTSLYASESDIILYARHYLSNFQRETLFALTTLKLDLAMFFFWFFFLLSQIVKTEIEKVSDLVNYTGDVFDTS